MDIDLIWILLGLPIAFALGWLASRLDVRQLRIENRQAPKAYFKGLNFLLNEQQDQAIDAFIEAVQNDPDTSELHFALGNLFRRRGEYQRAVRVHQHLLSRGDLSGQDRQRAQHALALDFLKAGLLDRAEEALNKLQGTRYEAQAQLALLSIYERARDWPQAAQVARRLQGSGEGSFDSRLAHYLCEQAADREDIGVLQQALTLAPQAPRPRLELALRLEQSGQTAAALDGLLALADTAPEALPLFALALVRLARLCHREAEVMAVLQTHYDRSHALDVLEALVQLDPSSDTARDWYARHLQHLPSLVAASRWMAGEKLEHEQFHPQVQRALDHAVKPLTAYRCAACGFTAKRHFWQCPGCQAWDSYPARRVEEL